MSAGHRTSKSSIRPHVRVTTKVAIYVRHANTHRASVVKNDHAMPNPELSKVTGALRKEASMKIGSAQPAGRRRDLKRRTDAPFAKASTRRQNDTGT